MNCNKYILLILCMTVYMFSAALKAENTLNAEQERVDVGNRALKPFDQILIQEQRAKEEDQFGQSAEEVEEDQPLAELPLSKIESTSVPSSNHDLHNESPTEDPLDQQSDFPEKLDCSFCPMGAAFHHLLNDDTSGEMIELEDGSIWKVAQWTSYLHAVSQWESGDHLTITQNKNYFRTYDFWITNECRGTSVQATLTKKGPYKMGRFSHWIHGINYEYRVIELEDGSMWQITGRDDEIFNNPDQKKRWLAPDYNSNQVDHIIIAVNSDWLRFKRPFILINVETASWVRVRKLK